MILSVIDLPKYEYWGITLVTKVRGRFFYLMGITMVMSGGDGQGFCVDKICLVY